MSDSRAGRDCVHGNGGCFVVLALIVTRRGGLCIYTPGSRLWPRPNTRMVSDVLWTQPITFLSFFLFLLRRPEIGYNGGHESSQMEGLTSFMISDFPGVFGVWYACHLCYWVRNMGYCVFLYIGSVHIGHLVAFFLFCLPFRTLSWTGIRNFVPPTRWYPE